ncbi:hypothetical protein ACET3Z_007581 [Daucus carota]
MLTSQKKLWSDWSLSEPAGQDYDENLDKESNVDEQSMMNMRKKLSELENELYDYQYQMGLLLMERKEWIANYEKLQQAFAETRDSLNQKQAAISDMEKREEDLRKALGVEKQYVVDLEKTLHKMHSQHAEIKFTSDLKLVEANALVRGIRDKSLEAESKLRAADAKDVDLSRKNLEIDRKLNEVDVKEDELQRERLSREAQTSDICKQRDDLWKWERKLQEGEQKLEDVQRLLDQREKLADIRKRVEELTFREKASWESDAKRKGLEIKEKELLELEEKLNVRANSMEEKVSKREQDLYRKTARLKEREKDFESKLTDLKEKEKSLKVEEEKTEKEKEKIILEEERLFSLKAQIEKSREDMEEERQRIKNESEILKLTEEERLGHSLLQLELKQEIDKCKSQREQLLEEREDLKQERDRFEKEWEHLDERIRLSDEERDKEIKEINYLKGVVAKEMEEVRLESSRIENEKQEIKTNQMHLDEKWIEMRRNNDELVSLSNKLKELREQFFKEKEQFLTFVEKHKSCKNCGDPFPEFVHSNLQSPASLDAMKTPTLPHLTDLYSKGHGSIHDRPGSEATSRAVDSGSPASTGTMSWLQKCTSKILTLSTGKKNDPAYTNHNFSTKHVHLESPLERLYSSDDSELQFGVAEDNLDLKQMQSNNSIREVGNGSNPDVNEQSKSNGEPHNVVEASQHSDQKLDPPRRGKRGRGKANVRHTVKTNVTDVKLRGNVPELNKNEHTKRDQAGRKMQRKRSRPYSSRRKQSDSDYTYSGGDSDSNITLGRRKRRNIVVPPLQTTSAQPYNSPVQTTSGQRYSFRQRGT